MQDIITGIDIGGTHITVCQVELHSMELIEQTRVRHGLDPSQSKEQVIAAWASAIKECGQKSSNAVSKIGIAMPGPFNYEKGISLITGLHKYESLYGYNVKELLAEALGIVAADIKMMNDATAFLLGEWKAGAGKGYTHLIGVTLGTGLGSAFALSNSLEDGDLWCFDYGDSRAEDVLCARWLINSYHQRAGHKVANVKELAMKVDTDPLALSLFQDFGTTLGNVLVKRFTEEFPDQVIVGGNIARSLHLIQPSCEAVLQSHGLNCSILPAILGENAALMGAACLWL